MNSPQYSRVASSEQDADNVNSPRNSSGGYVAGRKMSDRVTDKIIAILWIVAAMLIGYWVDFITILFSSPKANRLLLNAAFLCLVIILGLIMYLTIYLPRKVGLTDSSAWAVYCPRVIPIMSGTGVVAILLLIRGTWPVWGFFAPLILGVEFMGLLFSLHFIPWKSSNLN